MKIFLSDLYKNLLINEWSSDNFQFPLSPVPLSTLDSKEIKINGKLQVFFLHQEEVKKKQLICNLPRHCRSADDGRVLRKRVCKLEV